MPSKGGKKEKVARKPPSKKYVSSKKILEESKNLWNGDQNKINQLLKLKIGNGDLLVQDERPDVIYEVISILRDLEYNSAIEFFEELKKLNDIFREQPSMDEGKQSLKREIYIQQSQEIGVKGVDNCRYCGSSELVYAKKQTRSGDEPMTVFVRCVNCKKGWKE